MAVTLWSPDTCGCKILVDSSWTFAVESVNEIRTERCSFHASLDITTLFGQVYLRENKLRNQVLSHLHQNHLQLFDQVVTLGNREVIVTTENEPLLRSLGFTSADYEARLRPGNEVQIASDRIIEATLPTLTSREKTTLITDIETLSGGLTIRTR
jgi:hypothetical protein